MNYLQYLGIDHPQYFPGVSSTATHTAYVGVGCTPYDAGEDAIEQYGGDVINDLPITDDYALCGCPGACGTELQHYVVLWVEDTNETH